MGGLRGINHFPSSHHHYVQNQRGLWSSAGPYIGIYFLWAYLFMEKCLESGLFSEFCGRHGFSSLLCLFGKKRDGAESEIFRVSVFLSFLRDLISDKLTKKNFVGCCALLGYSLVLLSLFSALLSALSLLSPLSILREMAFQLAHSPSPD